MTTSHKRPFCRQAEAILWALYCARRGFVDEVVRFEEMRRYLVAFAGAAYQNPASICPQHHMLLPRLIRSQIVERRRSKSPSAGAARRAVSAWAEPLRSAGLRAS